jgi:hypothetical protein
LRVTAGHTDAVGKPGPVIDAVSYLIVATAVVSLVGVLAWRRWRRWGVLPFLGTAGALLLVYKHSFMRQDAWHVHMAPMVATAAIVLYAPALWNLGNRNLRIATAVTIALAGLVLTSILSSYTGESLPAYAIATVQRSSNNLTAVVGNITDPSRRRQAWEDDLARIRRDNPIAVDKVQGSVDVYPHFQDVVFAYHLPYAPRPAISGLVATAPVLGELDAEHLRGPSAPESILFDLTSVDQNFPTVLDGRSLPELLTRYDVVDTSGAFLVLRRASSPREFRLAPGSTRTARFEEPIAIPQVSGAPLWAHVRFKHRAGGKILTMLYKPPTLGIEVHLRDGSASSYRLLPSLAEEHGFLLSPLIGDRQAYAKLAGKSWESDLAGAQVTSITLFVADGSQDMNFEPQFELQLDRLEFPR